MNNFKVITIILMSVFIFQACSTSPEMEIDEVASQVMAGDFELELWQELSENGSSFQMIVRSMEEVPCNDAVLDANLVSSSTSQSIMINDVIIPSPCNNPGAIFPSAIVDLDVPVGNQVFFIDILNEVSTNGSLTHVFENEPILNQTIDKLSVNLISNDNLTVTRESIQLIPKGAIFGYIEIDDESISDIAKARISGLATHVYQLPEGDYGFFEIASDNSILVNIPQPTYAYNFLLESEDDTWDELADILGGIKEEYAGTKTKFWHWDGQVIEL